MVPAPGASRAPAEPCTTEPGDNRDREARLQSPRSAAPVYFRCAACASVVRATRQQAGQLVPCPRCLHSNVCPDTPSTPDAVPIGAHNEDRPSWSATRVSVAVLFVVAVAWGAWNVVGAPVVDTAPDVTLSAAEARQRELLHDNLDQPGDPQLIRRYRDINTRHFSGRLPDMPVIWEPRLAEVGALAANAFTLEGMFGHSGDDAAILLHPNLAADEEALARALAPEMVHAFLYAIGDLSTDHGPAFSKELRRLSTEGAFTGIVADEAERTRLRAWLDAEAQRLDEDSAAVRQEWQSIADERAALEQAFAEMSARTRAAAQSAQPAPDAGAGVALDQRRDEHNRRVEALNARTERGRAALLEFNRQVSRYNLMLVFPDGVDEEQLFAPRTPTDSIP